MPPDKVTRPVLAKHLAMCGSEVFGARYIALESLRTPGGVEVDLVAVSISPALAVHAVFAGATYSEARQALERLTRAVQERVANIHWLAVPFEAYVALGRPEELRRSGAGLIVVKAESTFGLGSAETLVELEPKPVERRISWPQLDEALRARGKQDLAKGLAETLGRKPKL